MLFLLVPFFKKKKPCKEYTGSNNNDLCDLAKLNIIRQAEYYYKGNYLHFIMSCFIHFCKTEHFGKSVIVWFGLFRIQSFFFTSIVLKNVPVAVVKGRNVY